MGDKMQKTNLIIGICILTILTGCDNYSTGSIASAQAQPCHLDSTDLFLHPAWDTSSDEPRQFENTTYEIMLNHKYLGKFKGEKNNASYLNLSEYDELDMIVSVNTTDCLVKNGRVKTVINCEPAQHIIPELKCYGELKYRVRHDTDYFERTLDELNYTVELYFSDEIWLRMELDYSGVYDYFTCMERYDSSNYIVGFTMEKYYTHKRLQKERIDLRPLYAVHTFKLDYPGSFLVKFRLEHDSYPFNTTVDCYFIDKAWYFHNNRQAYLSTADKNGNDIGFENPFFNFTIAHRG